MAPACKWAAEKSEPTATLGRLARGWSRGHCAVIDQQPPTRVRMRSNPRRLWTARRPDQMPMTRCRPTIEWLHSSDSMVWPASAWRNHRRGFPTCLACAFASMASKKSRAVTHTELMQQASHLTGAAGKLQDLAGRRAELVGLEQPRLRPRVQAQCSGQKARFRTQGNPDRILSIDELEAGARWLLQ